MRLGYPRSIPFSLIFALLALAFVFVPDDVRAQPVPLTKIENAAGDSVLTIFEDGGFAVYGEEFTGTIPATGEGTRLMWHPAKAAFRAGEVDGAGWDDANVGSRSVAFGSETEASGEASVAMGFVAVASGKYSAAMGRQATASGEHSIALGFGATANGDESTAMGHGTEASGNGATAMGRETTASAPHATAMGDETDASANRATAMGYRTDAATNNSLSIGVYNDANRGNDDSDPTTGPLFVVGNGPSVTSRSDALVLDQSGNLDIAGSLTQNSDRRLKEQIQLLGKGTFEKLEEIRPVRFRFKNEETHPSDEQIGLVAQEVQAQFPELVSEGTSGYLSVSYSKFTAVLLKGLQEQQAEIERLQAKVQRVNKLEARLAELERRGTARAASLPKTPSSLTVGGVPGGRWALVGLLGLLVGGVFAWRRRG